MFNAAMDIIFGMILFFAMVAIYLAPSLVAATRHHHNGAAIFVINLFLGWTFIGWVVALAWACAGVKLEDEGSRSRHDQTVPK